MGKIDRAAALASLRFSVVMATYRGDDPEQLYAAGESVFKQTRAPDELVIVCDGPVGAGHDQVIQRLSLLGPIHCLRLEHNVGPGAARHHGILAASHDVVAIMDADDICVPDRFERQLVLVEAGQVDVVGGWIREFNERPGDSETVRRVPQSHDEIARYAKRRSPMNNVTAMFRKPSYLQAGGYASMRTMEDYDLYVRMLLGGARFCNLPAVLVEVRAGRNMFERRGGLSMIPIESRLLYQMYRSGFFSLGEFLSNVMIRSVVRLLPNGARRLLYQIFLRDQGRGRERRPVPRSAAGE
ncbi:glycosyltransferase [Massilia solisilvae]|uniref:Glycosyltransferase n=1 Tax=Massilia solisilvae TaxID=1811225 RepID=A0ABT2BEQ6_9BURK|nr:glycosyltransferase [Massilia solisilvae]MCS0606998.1 glycosyltransferase [Massilia solisilvae]